ncbi:MAG: methylated-DNA--[protein]-cysteine S-methyltransferase [Lachnospiraceae bacterium]|nr:methylated-DNA--[protein]-cysteine S-methyltransferase [Lachnospiraceae bacterium]
MENNTEKNTFETIYDIVCQIPYGKVATYGQIAALAGNKRLSRVVGYALHVNPEPERIPCYRVVNRFGEVSSAFAFGGGNRQVELLQAEGVEFKDGRVDMEKYQWKKMIF